MAIKAALLDPRGVYLRMDELGSVAELTERHLPQIRACDLPSGEYLWIPDDRARPDGAPANEYGGTFWPLAWLRHITATRAKAARTDERAFAPRGVDLGSLIEYLKARDLAPEE